MFQQARIKLTAWYLIIIMCISAFFSIFIYRMIEAELQQTFQRFEVQMYERFPGSGMPSRIELHPIASQELEKAKRRLLLNLLNTNLVILAISAIAAYFLAGKTLRPIEKMVEEQSRFVADASHELRTPLTAMRTATEVTLRSKDLTIDQAKDTLTSNLEEINNLQSLTNNLLTLAQQPETASIKTFTKVNIPLVIEKAIKRVAPLAHKKQIEIHTQVNPATISADEEKLVELLVILLDNAVKYSPDQTKVTLSNQQIDGSVEIIVQDQGMGIPEKDIPFIFDRFYRTDTSRTKHDTSGFGLGLSIANKIVQEHSGSIQIKSKLQEGTSFIVKLPRI